MRARGSAVETARPVRSVRRRPAGVECGDGGREQGETRRGRPEVPEHSTFRRVAVFVPFR